MNELRELLHALQQPTVLTEIAVAVACLGLAWVASRLTGRGAEPDSVWFGRNTVDGLMFPLLALALTYAAQLALRHYQPTAVLRIVMPMLVSLAAIRLLARVFASSFPDSGVARLTERLFSWVAWVGAVLWIIGLLPALIHELESVILPFGKNRVSLWTVIEGTVSAGLVLVVVLWVSSVVERRLLRGAVDDLSLRKIAVNATRAILLLIGLLVALSAVGVDLTALSVLGGALGVGLGFGLQKLAANYVSGFVILFERSLRIGDTVRVDNFEGVVSDIKTRYTLIRAINGRESIVPNEALITQRIENLSLADPKLLLSTAVSVGYDSDPDQVLALLVNATLSVARVLREPGPAARLTNFGADGLEFTVYFWIEDPQNGQVGARSDVNLAILRALRAANVEIPYPQRVIHTKPQA